MATKKNNKINKNKKINKKTQSAAGAKTMQTGAAIQSFNYRDLFKMLFMPNHGSSSAPSFGSWKFIEILLALLFLVAPFYFHYHYGGEGLQLPHNVAVWGVVSVIVCHFLWQFSRQLTLVLPAYFGYMIAFPVLVTISGFMAGVADPMDWLFRLLFVWFGLLFLLALYQHGLKQGRIDRMLFVIVISALMQSIVGIWQAKFVASLPKWLPIIPKLLPSGVFQQINNQASYQVTAMVIALFLITRPYISKGRFWKPALLILFFGISSYVISLSASRTGLVAVALCIPLTLIGLRQRLGSHKKWLTIMLLAGVLGTAVENYANIQSLFSTEKVATNTTKSPSLASKISEAGSGGYSADTRVGIYAVSWDLIKQKPLFGHGLGSFESIWQYQKGLHQQEHDVVLISSYVTHPHNEVLFWILEGGIIAVIGIFLLVVGIVLSLIRNRQRWLIYLTMLLPIVIHTQLELPFYTSATHWFLILFVLYVLSVKSDHTITAPLSKMAEKSLAILVWPVIIVILAFSVHTFVAVYQAGNMFNKKEATMLWVAKKHPYFTDIVERYEMNAGIINALKNKSPSSAADVNKTARNYIAWAEAKIVGRPSRIIFKNLAAAHRKIRNFDKMCEVLTLSDTIYPLDSAIKTGLRLCKHRHLLEQSK